MEKSVPSTMLLLLTAAVVCLVSVCAGKEVQFEFKIVPNKAGDIEVALDTPPIKSSTCRFEWDSTGATVEQWVAKVQGDPRSGELECEIARRDGGASYLLFTKFKTTLGTNPILESLVHDNDGQMGDDNFELDGECVKNSHDWSGSTIRRIKLKSMVIS